MDYRSLVEVAEDLALEYIPLIETFAHRLAERCLDLPLVERVSVSVDKPFAITRGIAGVDISLANVE